jgi:beta-xylosidase
MYYSSRSRSNPDFHCVGTATSKTVNGPYKAADQPFACHISQGGAIDPSGYQDPTTGLRYVVYKIDGNHIGNGGDCLNTVEPIVATPIQLQQVGSDGVSPIGGAVTILDRDDSDGPLVEAPSLYRSEEGVYFLFFSSGCYTSPNYNVKYATATSISGPYTKTSTPLIESGDGPNLNGPGGARISSDGQIIVFHANLNPPGLPLHRAMFTARPRFSGRTVTI